VSATFKRPRVVPRRMVFLATTDGVHGREIESCLGLVRANMVRARHLGSDIGAGLKTLVGGRIGGYEKLMTETRDMVLDELQKKAEAMGADAVVGLRFATSDIMQGSSEILAYGTAVKLRAR